LADAVQGTCTLLLLSFIQGVQDQAQVVIQLLLPLLLGVPCKAYRLMISCMGSTTQTARALQWRQGWQLPGTAPAMLLRKKGQPQEQQGGSLPGASPPQLFIRAISPIQMLLGSTT
jgi:hypothetical protein